MKAVQWIFHWNALSPRFRSDDVDCFELYGGRKYSLSAGRYNGPVPVRHTEIAGSGHITVLTRGFGKVAGFLLNQRIEHFLYRPRISHLKLFNSTLWIQETLIAHDLRLQLPKTPNPGAFTYFE